MALSWWCRRPGIVPAIFLFVTTGLLQFTFDLVKFFLNFLKSTMFFFSRIPISMPQSLQCFTFKLATYSRFAVRLKEGSIEHRRWNFEHREQGEGNLLCASHLNYVTEESIKLYSILMEVNTFICRQWMHGVAMSFGGIFVEFAVR